MHVRERECGKHSGGRARPRTRPFLMNPVEAVKRAMRATFLPRCGRSTFGLSSLVWYSHSGTYCRYTDHDENRAFSSVCEEAGWKGGAK